MYLAKGLLNEKNIYDTKLRVTFYARVSTDNESQSSSIVNQINFFKDMIGRFGNWTYVDGYVDEGISGKSTLKREQFLKMIADGLKNRFDLVLTKSVSRFARNTIDSIKYTEVLRTNGVGVFFINDNINTFDSDSEFRLTLMASLAQDEVRKLSESVKFGLLQSIKRGVVLGNNNILGYRKNNGSLVIDEDEAAIVKSIYDLFVLNEDSYSAIAKVINKKYGKKLDSTGIKRVLTNPKYKGYYCGKKTEITDYKNGKRRNIASDSWIIYENKTKVPPIIAVNLWDRVNDIIKKKERKYDVFCLMHKRRYRVNKKKYKGKYYEYFVCDKCSSIDKKIILTLLKHHNARKFYVIPGDTLILKIKEK